MTWQVPRIWEGGDVWIVGGGPSLPRQFDIPETVIKDVMEGNSPPSIYSPYLSYLHNKHVIGINAAYLIGDWMDMIFFGDSGFFLPHQTRLANYPGIKITCHPEVPKKNPWVKYLQKEGGRYYGISSNSKMVSWNSNSGAAAISIAAHTGAKRIILLGFDMTLGEDGKQHWHSLYAKPDPKRRKIPSTPFERHLIGFGAIAADAARMGIEIINASPNSAIKELKKVTVKDLVCSSL